MSEERLDRPRIDPNLPASADPIGDVLDLLQLTGVLYCNAELSAPWGIEIPALPGVMNVEVVTSGQCWIELDGEESVWMPEGSVLLIPRGRRHRLRSGPDARVVPLQEIPVEHVGDRFERMRMGGGGALTRVTYYGVRYDPYLSDRLIRLFPEMLHLRTSSEDESWLNSTIRFIDQEAHQKLPGGETVITRLADILVIQLIRKWIEGERGEKRGWIHALHDRQIGQALSLMHRQPGQTWTVANLASAVSMSRSGFSARFSELVGESALHYLTQLRMRLAHRELLQSSDTLIKIAERVGYHSEPAFNRAFKRVMGMPPGAVRKN